MRVFGVDPGLQNTGWGVIEMTGPRLSYVGCGVIRSNSSESLGDRLAYLHNALLAVLREHRPDSVAVEETFVNKDARGALKLGHARGVAMLTSALLGLPVSEYAPNQVKKAVVGVGHADKSQIAHMVKRLLPGADPKSADAADALAIAICHAMIAPSQAKLSQAAKAAQSGGRR